MYKVHVYNERPVETAAQKVQLEVCSYLQVHTVQVQKYIALLIMGPESYTDTTRPPEGQGNNKIYH